MPQSVVSRVQFLVAFTLILTTLAVTPWMNLDPINLPKFLILVSGALAALGHLLPYWRISASDRFRSILLAVTVFVFALLAVLIYHGFSNVNFLFGTFGRNTGFISYLALAALFLATALTSDRRFSSRVLSILIGLGFINAVYGLVQWFKLDPVDWLNPYNPIVGTLGNPNFVSALLGIAAIACAAILLEPTKKLTFKIFLFFTLVISLVVIYLSDSSQGLLIFALGAAAILYFWKLNPSGIKSLKIAYILAFASSVFLSLMGLLNRGPLANLLYQDSVTYRGDYWRAGWRMTTDNPIFGVGLDSYGDWYRFYRTEEAALRRGPDITSNSAHNVFLDISSNGGFLLLACYLVLIALVIRSSVRILRRTKSYDPIGVGLVFCWLGYLVQSTISINQLGLAIWGWVLGGTIIGYEINGRTEKSQAREPRNSRKSEQLPPLVFLTGTLGLAVGVVISIWPLARDASFKSALQSGDVARVESATRAFPQDSYYFVYASQILAKNKLDEIGLEIAEEAVAVNPRDFNAWKSIIQNPKVTEEMKSDALTEMRKLDPYNNTLED